MEAQLDLLQALSRRTDPQTSRRAARRVDAPTLSERVLTELEGGPGTSHDLADRLGLSLVTVSPRMAPLLRRGLIEIDGERDGRQVWRLKS